MPKHSPEGTPCSELNGACVHFERSAQAKRMRVFVSDAGEVVVRMPKRASLRYAQGFVREHSTWLREQLAAHTPTPTLHEHLRAHPRLSAFGKAFELHLEPTAHRPEFLLSEAEQAVLLRVPELDDTGALQTQLKKLLIAVAKAVLPAHTHTLASKHALKPKRISVRDQRSRWGSCSSSGTLSLNWRLLLLPPEMHEHIILHELAHLRHMNHSPHFYELLHTLDPHTATHSKAINTHGALMRLGRV